VARLWPYHKHQTRQERLARDKDSNLLRTFVNYDHEKPYNIGPSNIVVFFCLYLLTPIVSSTISLVVTFLFVVVK
jgi:hypothetical protein